MPIQSVGAVLHASSGKSRNGAKRGNKIIHPDSRKAQQLGKKVAHEERQLEIRVTRAHRADDICQTVEWFQSYLQRKGFFHLVEGKPKVSCMQPNELKEAALQFVQRFDTDIAAARSQGKRSELEVLRLQLANAYFEEGMIIPDLTTRAAFQWVKNFDGSGEQARRVPMTKVHYGERVPDIVLTEDELVFTLGSKVKIAQKKKTTTAGVGHGGDKPLSLKSQDKRDITTTATERRMRMQQHNRQRLRQQEVTKARLTD